MRDICGISRITPRWGLGLRGRFVRRAMPYVVDLRAFSPIEQIERATTKNGLKIEQVIIIQKIN